MTKRPNDTQMSFEISLDQFYKKQSEKKQVSIYLSPDVIDALNKFGEANGKGAKSDLVNTYLEQLFNISQGQQVDMHKTSEQMIAPIENGQRLDLFFNHSDLRFKGDYELETKYQIENTLDRDLTEDEKLVMKIAYGKGYFIGGKDGMDKVLKS